MLSDHKRLIVLVLCGIGYSLGALWWWGIGAAVYASVALLVLSTLWWLYHRLNQRYRKTEHQLEDTRKQFAQLEEQLQKLNKERQQLLALQDFQYILNGALFAVHLSVAQEKDQTTVPNIDLNTVEVTGYSGEELFGPQQRWKSLVHEEDRYKLLEAENKVLRGLQTELEMRLKHPAQGYKWFATYLKPIKDREGRVTQIAAHFVDISRFKLKEEQLRKLAYYDELTSLPNRKMLHVHLQKVLAKSQRHQHTFAVMFIDIDDFKQVNDSLGHEAGDQLLQLIAGRMEKSIRQEDVVARLAGDEFVAVFEEVSQEEVKNIADRLIRSVSAPYRIKEHKANISLTIGVSFYPQHGKDVLTLLDRADQAMYIAKKKGKNRFELYGEKLMQELKENGKLLERLLHRFRKDYRKT